MSNARKLVPVNSPTLVLKRSEVLPGPSANDVLTAPGALPESGAPEPASPGLGTRAVAFLALCGVAAALGYGGYTLYTCLRDSFVVPTILSPSSPEVAATTLKLGELHVERVRAVAEIEGIDADLAGSTQAIERLEQLKRNSSDTLHWTSRMTSQKATTNVAEIQALHDQRRVIEEMLAEQQELTAKAQNDLAAGLISRAELARQQQALSQAQLALLDNARALSRGETALVESQLAQQALAREASPQMPELATRQEQMIRVDLEIVRIQAERRAKLAQRDALVERVAQVDEMVQQIEERPLFQALERELELAFVPYTQLEGVAPGAGVYSCVWGIFWCERVGAVAQMVPGEVVQADPFGSQVRGEYVVLALVDHSAARAKTLRIRGWSRPQEAPAAPAPAPLPAQREAAADVL